MLFRYVRDVTLPIKKHKQGDWKIKKKLQVYPIKKQFKL